MHTLKILFQLLSICLEGTSFLSVKFPRCWSSASERGMQCLTSTLCLAPRFSQEGEKNWIVVPTSAGSMMLFWKCSRKWNLHGFVSWMFTGARTGTKTFFLVGKYPSQKLLCQVTLGQTVWFTECFVHLCDPEQFLQKALWLLVYIHTRTVQYVFWPKQLKHGGGMTLHHISQKKKMNTHVTKK